MTQTQTAGTNWPAWLKQFLPSYEQAEACTYLFTGPGVADYVIDDRPFVKYFTDKLANVIPNFVLYSVSKGITFPLPSMQERFLETMEIPAAEFDPHGYSPANAVELLIEFLRRAPDQNAAVIIERVDSIVGEIVPVDAEVIRTMDMLHDAGHDPKLVSHGNPLVLLAEQLVDVRPRVRAISSGIKTIDVPLPTQARRLAYAKFALAKDENINVKLSGITVEQLSNLTAGLMLRHVENMILRARSNDNVLTRELALSVQRELMDQEYAGIVKRIDKPFKLSDVGGQAEAKAYFTNRVIKPLRDGDFEYAPNAILMVGPPGTAKTMTAVAVANDSGLNCLECDLSALLDGIVGGTEKKIALLRQALLANAPTMIFLDEIDQKVRRGEGGPDSGGGGAVENRLFASVLEMTESLKGMGIVWNFATNRPRLLDKAFISRMQQVVPMLPAGTDLAQAEILERILARLNGGEASMTTQQLEPFAARMRDWSGRDLEQVIREALANAKYDGTPLSEALDEVITYRHAEVADVKQMVKEAIDVTKDWRLVPERYRQPAQPQPKADNPQPNRPTFKVNLSDN